MFLTGPGCDEIAEFNDSHCFVGRESGWAMVLSHTYRTDYPSEFMCVLCVVLFLHYALYYEVQQKCLPQEDISTRQICFLPSSRLKKFGRRGTI